MTEETPTWEEQYNLGLRYLADEKYEEAIIAFSAAIEIDEKRPEAYIGRGDGAVGLEATIDSFTSALNDYETAVALDNTLAEEVVPKQAGAYEGRGDAYMAVDVTVDYLTAAIEDYEKAVTIEEHRFEEIRLKLINAYIDRGDTYMSLDDPDCENAEKDYRTVLNFDDQVVEAYDKLADVYELLEDIEKAIDILEDGYNITKDAHLGERIYSLEKTIRTVTAAGVAFNNSEKYREQWSNYRDQYQQGDYTVSIDSYGIQFSQPVAARVRDDSGTFVTVEILEACLSESSTGIIDELLQIGQPIEVTGMFSLDHTSEFEPKNSSDDPGLIYHPNGQYVFIVESYSKANEE